MSSNNSINSKQENRGKNLNSALNKAASEVRTITNQGTKMPPGADKDKRMMQLLIEHQRRKVRSRIPFYAAAYLGQKMGRLKNIQREVISINLKRAIDAYIDKYHICKGTGSHTRVKKIEEFGDLFGINTSKLASTTYKNTNWHMAKTPWEVLSLSVRPLTRREIVQSLKNNKNEKISNNQIKRNLNPRGNVNFVPSSLINNKNQNTFLGYAVDLLRMMAKETNNTNTKLKRQQILYDMLKRLKTQDDIRHFLREKLELTKAKENKRS